ncbi:MAG: argininosuccinate lyase [Coriobacteriia bacterium]
MTAGARKPWGGRFERSVDAFTEEFGASLPVDQRMAEQDIRGSIAHAKMLAARGIISDQDAEAIVSGLSQIYREIADGTFVFDIADEDVHMAVERRLIDLVGPAGGRLHTARSRNDQVATDTRLYCKDAALGLAGAADVLRGTLLRLAEEHRDVVLPGYTHLQRAQPILLSHHLLAYFWMLTRDVMRFRHAYEAADVLPLGSAALAGTTFPVDRDAVAKTLGFSAISANSLDAVSDRDFLLDLTYACAVAQTHLSRLCEELILWSTGEFGFITLDDAWATGSSIMPQKKNPDFAELVRGKTGRVVGDLTSLLVMLKGLPLAYNKDMQEDKPPAFDAIDTVADSLRAVEGMLATMTIHEDAMRAAANGGFMAATDLADHLAERGVPFRDAHEIVGRLVLACEREGRTLQSLTSDELRQASPAFGDDALEAVDIDAVVARRTSAGGTGHEAVSAQMAAAREALDADVAWRESLGG